MICYLHRCSLAGVLEKGILEEAMIMITMS